MRVGSRKSYLGLVVVLLGAALVGLYVMREIARRPSAIQSVRRAQFEGDGQLYVIHRGSQDAGYLQLSIHPTEHGGIQVVEESQIRLAAPGGGVQAASERLTQQLDSMLVLESFQFTLTSEAQSVQVEGRRTGDELRLDLATGGEVRSRTLSVPRDLVIGSGIWPRLALGGALEAGAHYAFPELDPASLRIRTVEIEVETDSVLILPELDVAGGGMDTVRAYSVRQVVSGLTTELLVAADGFPVHAALPLDMELERASMERISLLRSRWAAGDVTGLGSGEESLVLESAIVAGAPLGNARNLQRVVLDVRGTSLPASVDGGVQRRVGEHRVEVRAPAWPEVDRVRVPDSLSDYLAPAFFVESDHPEIVDAAAEATQGVRTDSEKALRIADWVYRTLEKRYVASVPSAIEVLRGGAGDCNEHTLLSVAMLRAAGLPARAVSGVAYLDGRFFFHAWPEVWLDGMWRPLDPTFGPGPADAARLRLQSGVDRLGSVVGLLGRLEIDVVEQEGPNG